MKDPQFITWISGLLQLCVACYALRLNRLFGTRRVGWPLFSAFSLLAILHAVQSTQAFRANFRAGFEVDVVYAVVSLLLLAGMVHIETVLNLRRQTETEQMRLRQELELRVKEQTADLIRINEELKSSTSRLEAEVAERKEISERMELTYTELLVASRQAGMSEVATNVLHNVGNVLNSVNISASVVADKVARFKAGSLVRAAALLDEHAADLPDFLANHPKGRQLPAYLGELAAHLVEEQTSVIQEMEFVKKKIEHIKDIVAMQQSYALVAGVTETVKATDLVEDAIHMNADALARHDVKLVREFEPHVPVITVEKHKVLQVLVNLVRNAKYACDDSGRRDKRVTVRLTNSDDRVRIIVSDNGVGIAPENLTRIFSHGFTTRRGGHGFGLHSGALVAKDLGGALMASSDGLGKGSTFTLVLPRERPAESR